MHYYISKQQLRLIEATWRNQKKKHSRFLSENLKRKTKFKKRKANRLDDLSTSFDFRHLKVI